MSKQVYDKRLTGNAAENYQRFFVPAIGAPLHGAPNGDKSPL